MNQVSVYAEVINLLSHMSLSESVGLNADANVICLLRCYTALPLAGTLLPNGAVGPSLCLFTPFGLTNAERKVTETLSFVGLYFLARVNDKPIFEQRVKSQSHEGRLNFRINAALFHFAHTTLAAAVRC